MDKIKVASEEISLFCRINLNTKKELPIRSGEMGFLIYLVKGNNNNTPIEIAKFFKFSKAMVTNMVSSLSKSGYLTKEKNSEDKRSIILVPTEKAIDLVEKAYVEYYKNMQYLEGKMGKKDFNQLIDLISKANIILLEEKDNG